MNSISTAIINAHLKVEKHRLAHRNKVRVAKRKREKVTYILSNMFLAILLVVGIAQIPTMVEAADKTEFVELQEKFNVVEFNVGLGDTAWDIQKELLPGVNMNEILYHLPKLNEGQFPSTLMAGQTYNFFVEKEGN